MGRQVKTYFTTVKVDFRSISGENEILISHIDILYISLLSITVTIAVSFFNHEENEQTRIYFPPSLPSDFFNEFLDLHKLFSCSQIFHETSLFNEFLVLQKLLSCFGNIYIFMIFKDSSSFFAIHRMRH